MKERLEQFLKLESLSPARFSEIIGIQRSGLSHILSGRNKPGYDFFEKVLQKFPQLNIEWLISGKGKAYKDAKNDNFNESSLFTTVSNSTNDVLQVTDNEEIKEEEIKIKASQNQINKSIVSPIIQKRALKRVIILYDDETFESYNKGE